MAAYEPRPEWVREAVRSALDQQGCSLELILVDDGSSEPVADLLDGLADERLRLLRTVHGGVSHARNAGTSASIGTYLRFVDADDVLPADSTAALLELAHGSDSVIPCGATRWCDKELQPIYDWIAACRGDVLRSYLLLRCTPMLPSMLFPRRVIEAVGPWEPSVSVGEDWDFILRALEHGSIVETRRAVTWYRQHADSASRDTEDAWRGTLLGVERYFQRHPAERDGQLGRRVLSMLGLLSAELGTPGAPWRDRRFWRALARDPSCLRTIRHRYIHPRVQAARMRLRRVAVDPAHR